jgi:hypothetical protein
MRNFNLRKFLAENRKPTGMEEMASTSKLENHEDYKFMIQQLEAIVKDEQMLYKVKRIVDAVGELGLDLGYAERIKDQDI